MFKSWKTTLAGLGSVLTGTALIIKGDPVAGVSVILTGLGLIQAKDHDVTGRS